MRRRIAVALTATSLLLALLMLPMLLFGRTSAPAGLRPIDVSPAAPFALFPGLYLYDMKSGEVRRAASGTGDDAISDYTWSPDNSRIALVRQGKTPAVSIVDAKRGTELRRVDLLAFSLRWLNSERIAVYLRKGKDGPEGMALMDAGTGSIESFVQGVGATNSAWSPDGGFLVWAPAPHEADGLWIIDAKTGVRRQVAIGPHAAPSWSVDGQTLQVYGWRESDQANGLKVFKRQGDDLVQVSFTEEPPTAAFVSGAVAGVTVESRYDSANFRAEQLIYVGPAGAARPSQFLARGHSPQVSPDGSKVAYVKDGALWSVTVADGKETSLVKAPLPIIERPQWSPDGTEIAFTAGGFATIYLADVDGSNQRELTTGFLPQFSPDGSLVSFIYGGGDSGISGALYTINLDGRDIRPRAPFDSSDLPPICFGGPLVAWSPTGDSVAVTIPAGGSSSISIARLDENPPTIQHGSDATGTAWSPDGTKIAYTGFTSGPRSSDVFAGCRVTIADAYNVRTLATIPGARGPLWSPDGKWLLVFTAQASRLIDMNDTTQVVDLGHLATPAWSPDGSLIAYAGPNGALMVMDVATLQSRTLGDIKAFGALSWDKRSRIIYSVLGTGLWAVSPQAGAAPENISPVDNGTLSPDGTMILYTH